MPFKTNIHPEATMEKYVERLYIYIYIYNYLFLLCLIIFKHVYEKPHK